MIENTSDPANRDLTGHLMLATGDPAAVMGAQEKAGQRQIVNSDRIPTSIDERTEWEAVGFTFGEPDPSDPLFMPCTLPEGWTREGSDHDMWSYIVDPQGRRRVAVFYKAAFYDRRADAHLISVGAYVGDRIYNDKPIVTDDTWATATAVLAALRSKIAYAEEQIQFWDDHSNAEYVAQYTDERDKCAAAAAQFDA